MWSRVRHFLHPYLRYLVIGPACKLVEVVFDLMVPLVIARMIDSGVGAHDVGTVLTLGLALLVMALLGLCFTLVCQKMAALTSQGVGTDLRRELYAQVNRLSSADVDRFGTPSLVTRITNDVNQLQVAIALGVRQVIRWPLLAVGSMVAALLIDLRLGVVFLVVTPIIGLVFWFVMSRCVPYFQGMQAKLDRISLICREALSGTRVIRAFVRDDHERDRFRKAAWDQTDAAVAAGRLSALLNPTTLLVMDLGVVAILWAGGIQVDAGALTQGQVVAFVNYMTQTLLSIVYVANLVVVFTKAAASASRVDEVLACEPSLTDDGNAELAHPAGADALELEHVSFSYPTSASQCLTDVSLRLGAGRTLGVIGGTGSGKTTLASLLLRLYDATDGVVRVLGDDVRNYTFSQLRHEVSLVPQQASLVSGTIRSNLCWRDGDATDEALWGALEVSQAADFVRERPEGLETVVEAGGRNFSGGQRQRLTIARALVGSPRLLVLDDASSALDFATDAALRRSLATRMADTSCVIVSQRVSAVRSADLICVLDDGHVVGLGTHESLLAHCPIYGEICSSQLKAGEVAR